MKTLYLECNMGAAGDMLTAALLELVPDQEKALGWLQNMHLPHVQVTAEESVKCGIRGTHMKVEINGLEEHSRDVTESSDLSVSSQQKGITAHHHSAQQEGVTAHHHHHSSLADVERIIDHLTLPEAVDADAVKKDIRNVYRLIAQAEGHAHGMPVEEIHFHEVGTMDAIFDVSAFCLLMHVLHPDHVIASPVRTGFGEVQCAHGIMPVPAPATAYLLEGIPTYGGDIRGEMCTPTGAALLKYFVKEFASQPVMRVEKVGYGMGTKDFPAANCVRAFLGETGDVSADHTSKDDNRGRTVTASEYANDAPEDQILELRANIDDMTGEDIGYAMEQLFRAGARDVFTTPIAMKKNRPGILLTVICLPSEKARMVQTIFRYTTTIGIRETICRRSILSRRETIRKTPYGDVRIKTSSGYGVQRAKAEYDDLCAISEKTGKTLEDTRNALSKKFQKENHTPDQS